MKQSYVHGAASLVACLALLAATPARAQAPAPQESVEVIVSPRAGQSHTGVRNFFQAFKEKLVGGYILPMTRCEKWSVPKSQVEAVKKEAAKRGVVVTELGGARFEHMMQSAPDDTKLNAKQRAMLERAKAAKATQGVKLMMGPPPAVLEHALTKEPGRSDGGQDHGRAGQQHHQDHRAHQRRHQARHVHLARHDRGDRGAGHADVVAERQHGRHGAGAETASTRSGIWAARSTPWSR